LPGSEDGDSPRASLSGHTVRMRAWLLVLLAVVIAGAGFLWQRGQDDDKCEFSQMAVDGSVLPGGPQTAEEALQGFLGTDLPPEGTPSNPSDYERSESSDEQVTFVAGSTTIDAYHHAEGWTVQAVATWCSPGP